MSQSPENIEKIDNIQGEQFKDADTLRSEDQFKKEINRVADDAWKKGFISKESYDFYIKLSLESSESQQNTELLKNMYKYSKEHHSKASIICGYFEQAKKNGYMSAKDEKFLMSKIIHQPEFVSQFSSAERLIQEKLNRMKKDRDLYDQIANHKLVKNVGYLKIDKNTKIDIPDEKKFLEMKVPERRELLNKLQEALPKAEKYAEESLEVESHNLENNYRNLLNKAYKEDGVIGLKTYNKFWDGFQKIDNEERKYWIKEFNNQIGRYAKLWDEIRGNLKKDELKQMEDARNKMGYTELFTKYGEIKKSLDDKYETKLDDFIGQGIIGAHVKSEFMSWVKDRSPKNKYDAIDKMHDKEGGQMERYKKLWNDIDQHLSKDQKIFMESRRDTWGYKEIKKQYDQFLNSKKNPSAEKNNPLSAISSTAIKIAIIRTNIDLKKRGGEQRKTFLSRLRHMIGAKEKPESYAVNLQSDLRKDRTDNHAKALDNIPIESSGADNIMDLQKKLKEKRSEKSDNKHHESDFKHEDIERAHNPEKKYDIVKEEGFTQITESENDGHKYRKAQLEINRTKGMERFLIEDKKREFRSKKDGGKDDISLAVHTDDGRTVNLDLTQIRAMEKYLENEEAGDLDKTA